MVLLQLLVSAVIDIIGYATYLIPIAGETADAGWAPVSSGLIYYLYGNGWLAGLALVEEILPGSDFVPTASIAWLLERAGREGRSSSHASSSQATG